MKRYAQIVSNKVQWVFEAEETLEQLNQRFSADTVFVDVTDKPEVDQGWSYDGVNFSAPVGSLDELKQRKLTVLKQRVAPEVVFAKAPDYKQINAALGIYDITVTETVKKWINAVRQATSEIEAQILAAQNETGLTAISFNCSTVKARAEQIEAAL